MLIFERLRQVMPFLSWPKPSRALWRSEGAAGLSVALLMVPQSVAYAALAGMPLVTGLYAALWPALVGLLWGGSTRVSAGPTALTCLMVSASLTGLAQPGSAQWVQLAIWLALLAGVLQWSLGLLRCGWLLNLVSSPVMMGFTHAAALLIMGSQLPALLGLQGGWGPALHTLLTSPTALAIDVTGFVFGTSALAVLWAAKRWRPQLPTIMAVVLGAGCISWACGYGAQGGAVVGALPVGLPPMAWPTWPGHETFFALLLPAAVIALVSFLETAASARNEHRHSGTQWPENQDLIGQGMAKVVSALCGSFATSASFSRSAIYLHAGARSGWAALVTVACVGAALLATGGLQHVPRAVLAAVVMVAVVGLVVPAQWVQLWRISRMEAATAATTFAATLAAAPHIHWGVLAGVLMALSHFLHTRLHPRIIEVGQHPDGSLRDRHLWQLAPLGARVYALRMDAELDFAAAHAFERAVRQHMAAHPQVQHVCVLAQPINRIDATGVQVFAQLRQYLHTHSITLHICGIKLPVETALRHAGELVPHPLLQLYRTEAEAVQALALLPPLAP